MLSRNVILACCLSLCATAQDRTPETLERRYLDAEARGLEATMLESSLEILRTITEDPAAFGPLRSAAFEVHLGRTMQMANGLARQKETIERLESLTLQHLDGWMDSARLYTIQRLAHFGNDLERARRATRDLGFVQRFLVLGPLDNERGSGFGRSTPAEEAFDASLTLRGKERQVGWRTVTKHDDLRGIVSLDALFRPNDQVMAYALAFFESDEELDVVLDLASDDALQVIWNGRRVASHDVRRTYAFPQDRVVVHMRRGVNACLLKLCAQEGRWRFSLRVTDLEGDALDDLHPIETPPARVAWTEGELPLSAMKADGLDSARTAAESGDALANVYLAALLFERGAHDLDEHPEREPLERALKGIRHAGVAHRLAVSHAQRGKRIAAELDLNPFRKALENVLEIDPQHVPTLSRLFQLYAGTLPIPETARTWLARLEEAAPASAITLLTQAAWLEQRRRTAEALVRLDDPRHVNDWRVQQRRAQLFARLGRHPEALACAERVLERVPAMEDALEIVIDHALHRGDLDRALELITRHVEDEPWNMQRVFDLVRVRRVRGEDEIARALLADLHETCPEDARVLEELATIEFALERREDGLKHLERAVALDPKNTSLERYLRYHQRQRSPFYEPYRVPLDEILESDVAAEAIANARARNLPVVHLWKQHVIKLNADYTTSRYVHLVTRILGEEGVTRCDTFRAERQGEAAVRFLEARVLSADGRATRADTGSSRRREMLSRMGLIDLPPVAVSDLVEVIYQVDDLRRTWFGDYYGEDHPLTQGADTTIASELVVIHPPDVALRSHLRNLDPTLLHVETNEGDDLHVTRFRTGPLEAPVAEPAMPAGREILPSLELTTYASWEAFTRWWWNLVSEQQRTSPEMRERVTSLVEGADTDLEKIRRVYEFVANEIDYEAWEFGVHGYKPYDAPTIYSRRHGDCKDKAILINAMLGAIGIPSYPVLIRAEELRSEEDLTLPRVGQFNHCISFVPGQGDRPDLFLDGTAEGHPIDALPGMDRGARVVIVQAGEPVLRVIPEGSPEDNLLNVTVEATLDDALGALLDITWEARGLQGAELRRAFRGEELLRTKKLSDLLTARFGETEVLEARFSDMHDLERPVRVDVRARVSRFALGDASQPTLPHVLLEADLMDVCSSTERVQDVLFPAPRQWQTTFTYHLSERYEFTQTPPAVELDAKALSYSVICSHVGRQATVTRRFVQGGTRVPVEDYAALRALALGIQESERATLNLASVR